MAGKLARIEASVDPQMLERWQAIKPLIVAQGQVNFYRICKLWKLSKWQTGAYMREMRGAGLPVPYPENSSGKNYFGSCPHCERRHRRKRRLQVWVDERDGYWRFCLYCGYEVIE